MFEERGVLNEGGTMPKVNLELEMRRGHAIVQAARARRQVNTLEAEIMSLRTFIGKLDVLLRGMR